MIAPYLMGRIPVLGVVELFPHHVVERGTLEVENLLEGLPEVAVQGRVDDGVEETVGVA